MLEGYGYGAPQKQFSGAEAPKRERHIPAAANHLNDELSRLESVGEELINRLDSGGVLMSSPRTEVINRMDSGGVLMSSPRTAETIGMEPPNEPKPPLAHALHEKAMRVRLLRQRLEVVLGSLET